jgi:hypothetical protein
MRVGWSVQGRSEEYSPQRSPKAPRVDWNVSSRIEGKIQITRKNEKAEEVKNSNSVSASRARASLQASPRCDQSDDIRAQHDE